jgi:hypothetical protein
MNGPVAPRARGRSVDPGAVIGEAWAIFSMAWPACLVCYWGTWASWWLIVNFLAIILASLNAAIGDPEFTPFLEFARFLGAFLVPAWLWLGQGLAFLKLARRRPATLEDLFRGGPYLLTALLAAGVFLAITAIPCLIIYGITEAVLALGGGESLVATVWRQLPARTPETLAEFESALIVLLGLRAVVLGLSFASFFAVRVRLRPFAFLILDREAGVVKSLRLSLRLSRGRVASLFLIHLAQWTINFAGALVCCLGLFVSLPFTSLISAVTYDMLVADLPPIDRGDGEAT